MAPCCSRARAAGSFYRAHGDLFSQDQVLVQSENLLAADAFGVPQGLVNCLPWLKEKQFARLIIHRIETAEEVYRRVLYAADKTPAIVFCDCNTLVLSIPDRAAEIWDLPPAKRWGWIIGAPAALGALPWLRKIIGRKRASTPMPVKRPCLDPMTARACKTRKRNARHSSNMGDALTRYAAWVSGN